MLQTLNTLAGKISPHNGSDSGRLINNNIIANNNNTYNNNDKCGKLKRKIFNINNLEDEKAIDLNHLLFIWNPKFGCAAINDWKIDKIISIFCGRKIKLILRKPEVHDAKNKPRMKITHRYNAFEMETIFNKNIEKEDGQLCFDGIEDQSPSLQDMPEETESGSNFGSIGEEQNEDLPNLGDVEENLPESPKVEREKSPVSVPTLETSSYHYSDPLAFLDKKMDEFLSKTPKGSILALKESMKEKLISRVLSEEYILSVIDDYQNLKKKKKKAIENQKQIINRIVHKRIKKPLKLRKYFYIRSNKEPSWEDEIVSSGSSVMELNTEADEPEQQSTESEPDVAPVKYALEKIEQPSICEDSEKSISCPSESDFESRCKCLSGECVCNELSRFRNFLTKKYECDNNTRVSESGVKNEMVEGNIENEVVKKDIENEDDIKYEAAEVSAKLTEQNLDRWDDLCHLNEVSQWSEETSLEVTSTSSSSCCIVRKCHCSHCNCGCDEYREYLLYKLYQVESRRRRRNKRRAEKAETLHRIIADNYKEDDYTRSVREFINEYYVKQGDADTERPNVCSCGLYNCDCAHISIEESENDEKDKGIKLPNKKQEVTEELVHKLVFVEESSMSVDDEKRRVRFGSQDSTGGLLKVTESLFSQKEINGKGSPQPTQDSEMKDKCGYESISHEPDDIAKDSEDIYAVLSRFLEKSDTILKFNIDDYLAPDEGPEKEVVESEASSYGSFDYKKYLVKNECNCEDYMKYYKFKTKTRRIAEKNDPLLKYFRKRLLYVSSLAKAEKILDHTSSETESPVRVPEIRMCEKYTYIERKKNIFKKKKRKLEKKVILDIIKKGNHLYPCECHLSGSKQKLPNDSLILCEECQVHLKDSRNKKVNTKIEPSIELQEIDESSCVLGINRTFPECIVCKENSRRIQFINEITEQIITDDHELRGTIGVLEEAEASSRDTLSNLNEQGRCSGCGEDKRAARPKENEIKQKVCSKLKMPFSRSKKKGKKKQSKKEKGSKKKKGESKKKKRGAKNKKGKSGKKKKNSPKDVNEVMHFSRYSSDNGLDVAVSLFDPRIVFTFGEFKAFV